MASMDENILRVTKEIIVKFIETGRVSPAKFNETFKDVYNTVKETVNPSAEASEPETETKS
jgi:predicted transcriptional regulator